MKTVLYLGLLTGILIALGSFFGGINGALLAFGIAFALNFFSYWYSDRVILMMYRAKELSEDESPHIHKIVSELSEKAGIIKPRIFLIPLDAPNAFATGRNEKKAVIGITLGLLNYLDKEELKGVIAHEIGHIKHKDILIGSISATIAGAITIIGRLAYFAAFLIPSDDSENRIGSLLSYILFIILTPLLALMIQFAISRSREYLADRESSIICNRSDCLIRALKKLEAFSLVNPVKGDSSNRITAHLFIVNPFERGFVSNLFSTHPSTEDRIKRLNKI